METKLKKCYSLREMEKILKDNGFIFLRQSGSHRVYQNEKGRHATISCSRPNGILFQRIIKDNDIKVN